VSVLAGATGKARTPGRTVPRSVDAAAFHFHMFPRPLGVRPDGSLIIADGDIIWTLAKGRLTRIYRIPKPYPAARNPRVVDTAVNGAGTVYLTPYHDAPEKEAAAPPPTAGDVITIGADGTVGRLVLPASTAGITGGLAWMPVYSLAGDGADGVYIHTGDEHASYVVHVHAGAAEVVARHVNGKKTGCKVPAHPVDAMNLPCDLPWDMAADRPGSLVMAGDGDGAEGSESILQIATR
jgi:hypothetical protein